MAVSYNRLWKLLIDKKMSKADLRKASGMSPNTMTKLNRDEPVMLNVLYKICKTLVEQVRFHKLYLRERKSSLEM